MEGGATAIVTFLLSPPHAILYVVVLVKDGVVNEPDAPLMPLGEDVHEVPSPEVQVMTDVVLAAPYGIMAGDAETYMLGAPEGCPLEEMLPPHDARPEITDNTVKQATGTTRDLTTVYFDMSVSLK